MATSAPTQARPRPVVTIDGPAGSGKSTTARAVAHRLGLRHLDSGALYRAVTFALLDSGIDEKRWPSLEPGALAELGVSLEPSATGFEVFLDGRALGDEIRGSDVTSRVSFVASLPAVRQCLMPQQRRAGERAGLVADGRDMGTVVFPDADLKVYLIADLHERARRRLQQRTGVEPDAASVGEEAARIDARDRSDSTRDLSPLRRADDAILIDTTAMTFEEQVAAIVAAVEALAS